MIKEHSKKIFELGNLENQKIIKNYENVKKNLEKQLINENYISKDLDAYRLKYLGVDCKKEIKTNMSQNILNQRINETSLLIEYFRKDFDEQSFLLFEFEKEKLEKKLVEKENKIQNLENEKTQLENSYKLLKEEIKNIRIVNEQLKTELEKNLFDFKIKINGLTDENQKFKSLIESEKKDEFIQQKSGVQQEIDNNNNLLFKSLKEKVSKKKSKIKSKNEIIKNVNENL